MDRYPYTKPPRWWSPLPQRACIRFWEPLRRYQQLIGHRITRIDVKGLEHVSESIDAGHGILVTPNHAGHGDCYLLLDALTRLRQDYFFMTAWQVFHLASPMARLAYRHHGCFSVDRETSDLSAYREAVRILAETSCPLVVFPEGDVYHLAEHVLPPRDGTLTIAMAAVRRTGRPVACLPCGLQYEYVEDPTPGLIPVIEAIEQRLGIAAGGISLAERTERLLGETIRSREESYFGQDQAGAIEARLERLRDEILYRAEHLLGLVEGEGSVPERVKNLRQEVIRRQCEGESSVSDVMLATILEDAFIAVQLYSYVPGYVSERPTIERIAETVDKLEEDVLGFATARIRGRRQGTITFGPPIMITAAENRDGSRRLSRRLRQEMQDLVYPQTVHEPVSIARAGDPTCA